MTNKQALRRAAVKIGAEKWVHIGGGEVITEQYEVDGLLMADHICNCEVTGTSSPKAKFIAAANPAAVLALLDELEVAEKRIAELEAREVKMPELKMLRDYLAEVTHREREDILLGVKLEFHRALQAAGIITKVGE